MPVIGMIDQADARDWLREIPSASVDAVITDPPYAEVDRDYGRLREADWHALMDDCMVEFQRILKPHGSALIVLQPNSAQAGVLRTWIYKFALDWGQRWNIVQDAYWHNPTALPSGGATRNGLMRASMKWLLWFGASDCTRYQDAVLLPPTARTTASLRMPSYNTEQVVWATSGQSKSPARMSRAVRRRGGVTPYNVISVANNHGAKDAANLSGHPAGTPSAVVAFWVRYLTAVGDLVCDPFMGSGTTALVARSLARRYIGCERDARFAKIANDRLSQPYTPLLFEE